MLVLSNFSFAEESLDERFEEQNQRIEAAKQQVSDSRREQIIARYMGLIKKQVENSWRKPESTESRMSCDVYALIALDGDVLKTEASNCTGDDEFKGSVEDAVRNAAPLPLPPNKSFFEHFREITFEFRSKE